MLHVHVKREFSCTTWPSFPFPCRLPVFTVHYFYTYISSFSQFFIHKNMLPTVFICSFSILRNSTWIWCLRFAVYVKFSLSRLFFSTPDRHWIGIIKGAEKMIFLKNYINPDFVQTFLWVKKLWKPGSTSHFRCAEFTCDCGKNFVLSH